MDRQADNFWAFEERHPFLTLWLILLVVAIVLCGLFGIGYAVDGFVAWINK